MALKNWDPEGRLRNSYFEDEECYLYEFIVLHGCLWKHGLSVIRHAVSSGLSSLVIISTELRVTRLHARMIAGTFFVTHVRSHVLGVTFQSYLFWTSSLVCNLSQAQCEWHQNSLFTHIPSALVCVCCGVEPKQKFVLPCIETWPRAHDWKHSVMNLLDLQLVYN